MQKSIYLLVFFLCVVSSFSFGLKKEEIYTLIDEADMLFINGNFKASYQKYEIARQELAKIPNLTPVERTVLKEIEKTMEDLVLLDNFSPVMVLLKEIPILEENKEFEKQWEYYQNAKKIAAEKNLNFVPYFSYIKQGKLVQAILTRKREALKKTSSRYLLQVEQEKKKKKTISFIGFQKDPKLDLDIQTLFNNIFFNAFNARGSFFIKESDLNLSIAANIEKAKASNYDLVAAGSYKGLANERLLFYLYVVDPVYSDNRLIEIVVEGKLDLSIFDTVQDILNQIEGRLRNYSRLEGFETIRYNVKEGKVESKVEKTEEIKEEKADFQEYIEQKIGETEDKIKQEVLLEVESILKGKEELLNYHKAGKIILDFNQKPYKKKIVYKDFVRNVRPKVLDILRQDKKIEEWKTKGDSYYSKQFYGPALDMYEKIEKYFITLKKENNGVEEIIASYEEDFLKQIRERKEKLESQKNYFFLYPYSFYIGINYGWNVKYDNQSDMVMVKDFPAGLGLSVLARNAVTQSIFYHIGLSYWLPREADVLENSQKSGTMKNTLGIYGYLGIDYRIGLGDILDAGPVLVGGGYYAGLKNTTILNQSSSTSGIGYRVSGGVFIELRYLAPLRLQVFYDYGKAGDLKLSGLRLELLLRILSF